MKKFICLIYCLANLAFLSAQEARILPKPVQFSQGKAYLDFGNTVTFDCAKANLSVDAIRHLENSIPKAIDLHVENNKEAQIIQLVIDANRFATKEAYSLGVDSKGIVLTASGEAGLFYGIQTFLQSIAAVDGEQAKWRIPHMKVEDQPRFDYRGAMLDVSRHFFSIDQLKQWLDILAYFKINTFHWHLTDDQGWRIEIKKYPELQKKAAYRNGTLIGHKKELPHRFDGKRYGGYYSQEEVKDLVAYARSKQITVIPEIEMPGHARAALSAYPQLGCTGGPYETAMFWGIFDDVYCAGKEETFTFLEDVLSEVIPLFPGQYIHIGGDECLKDKWRVCPHCQKRIEQEHLKDEFALQSYFMQRISDFVNSKGKRIIGWDEILEGGLVKDATIMSWTGEEGGIHAAKAGHDAIMSPEKYVYLDYYQSLAPEEPLAAGGYTSLEKIYTYQPVPAVLSAEEAKHIIGVQANLWSEYLDSEDQVEYMLFPRILALAEIAWTGDKQKDFADFVIRVQSFYPFFKAADIHYADVLSDVQDSIAVDGKGQLSVQLKTADLDLEIWYSTKGADYSQFSTYKKAVSISKAFTLYAQTFRAGQPVGRLHTRKINYSLSTGRNVVLASETYGNYRVDPKVLSDGKQGTSRYNDGAWIGASGGDVQATVDLGRVRAVSGVETHFLNYVWQKMWLPTTVQILVSTDGKDYETIFEGKPKGSNGINAFKASFRKTKARFVQIKAVNQGKIPAGYYGAGGKPWLLLDELSVY